MSDAGGNIPTPHQFQWMEPMYAEVSAAADWPQLSPEVRAERLLEKYEQWQADLDKPKRDDFPGSKDEKLKHMQRVIFYFENQREP
jgi:hypothetical protein